MNNFMHQALAQAQLAAANNEVPVGAVIIWNGEIIARAHNRTEEYSDPTAHAEMLVIQQACKKLGAARIPECDLYVTLEPCPMCVAAISFARIRRLYYGASDAKSGGIEFFNGNSCHHHPEIYSGISESETSQLLKDFFLALRNAQTY